MIVNPKLLLDVIIDSFEKYIKNLKENDGEFTKFKDYLEKSFKEEIEYSRAS